MATFPMSIRLTNSHSHFLMWVRCWDSQHLVCHFWETIYIYIHIIYIYIPIGSMYAIYGNIYHQYTPNVSIYTIHGSYGIWWGSLICTAVYPKLLCVLKTKFDFPLGVGIRNPSCTSGTHVCQYPNLKPHPWFEHTLQSKLKIQTYLRWESTGAYPNVNNWKSFSRIWHL